MTLGFKSPALQGLAVLVTALSGCGGAQENTERSHAAGSDSTAAEGEVAISAHVEGNEGLSLSAAVIDYKLTVRCSFAGQQLEKIYTSAQLAAAGATMPKGATNCYAFPSEVRLGPAPEIVFLPPAPAITGASFNNFSVGAVLIYQQSPAPTDGTAAEAIVRLDNALDKTLNRDTAAVAYDLDFRRRDASLNIVSNVTVDQSKLGATIQGQNAPAFTPDQMAFLTIAANQPSDRTKCDYDAHVVCTVNPVAGADGKLKSCDGVDVRDLRYEFTQAGSTSPQNGLNGSDIPKTATAATLPITIACDRTGATPVQTKSSLALRIINMSDGAGPNHSSIAFPFSLTINTSLIP